MNIWKLPNLERSKNTKRKLDVDNLLKAGKRCKSWVPGLQKKWWRNALNIMILVYRGIFFMDGGRFDHVEVIYNSSILSILQSCTFTYSVFLVNFLCWFLLWVQYTITRRTKVRTHEPVFNTNVYYVESGNQFVRFFEQ